MNFVGMDACTYLHYVTFIYAVFFCTQSICCEAPVRLFLYQSPNVYQVDVKEFVVVGNNDILIGCTTTVQDDDSTDTRITLRDGDNVLESQNSSQLIWNAITTGFFIYQRVYPDRQKTAASKTDEPDHQETAASKRDVEMTITQTSEANDDPYYYATSVQSDDTRRDGDQDEKGPADSSYMELTKDAEHLSSDMLEYGAVVVDNDAYQEHNSVA
ncbi:uncharacterized protein [Apostichopus japonicus]|uniref:uncharacterized protein n=1 Tax=Stichopus japonicus TaxID=307972 RepID=UPI003AB7B99A